VLALQGDFAEHERALQHYGLRTRQIRRARELEQLDGLVLPGGESTTMLRLIGLESLESPLLAALQSGVPVLATCAGLILLAAEVLDPQQRSFGLLDVTVQRNGYGRQLHSGTYPVVGSGVPAGTEGVFIRAPRITRCGPEVEVLARRGDDPVLVQRGPFLGACFHPELQPDHVVTRRFVAGVRRHAAEPKTLIEEKPTENALPGELA
jgi:5'-phosphate synthase pdxT subunit